MNTVIYKSELVENLEQSFASFTSITQYDKRFDGMFEQIKNKGYSCSYFSVLTCLRFLQGYTPDVDTHEKNIILYFLNNSYNITMKKILLMQ